MPKERILITVKTYPTISSKYGELVCTAGLRADGSWIRIYPVPFRQLEAYQKFPKYSFIEAEVIRNTKDARPESHKVSTDTIELTGEDLYWNCLRTSSSPGQAAENFRMAGGAGFR